MANITLAGAVKLKSILRKRIQELEMAIYRVAYTKVEGDATPEKPTRALEVVDAELLDVRADSRTLDRLIYEANSHHTINFDGKALKLVEAIELATQFRAHADIYKNLSHAEKRELDYMNDELPIYTVALFDPEHYRVEALTFERHAHKLSNAVNAKNYQIELDFDEDKYF